MNYPGLYLLLIFFFLFDFRCVDGDPASRRLFDKLLTPPHQVLERPVKKNSDLLIVKLGITLLRLINVDVSTKHIETNIWLSLDWNDQNLVWNPAEYDNITDIRLPPSKIWVPDIYIYNQVGDIFDTTHPTWVVVKHDGNCSYIPPGVFITSCGVISLEDYPFDEHHCDFKLGSWTHDGHQMDLEMTSEEGGDITSFTKNSEWTLLGVPGKKNSVFYSCCPEPYVDVTFTIQIKRKGELIWNMAWSMNFVICFTMFLSTLLPPSTGLKINLGLFGIGLCAFAERAFNPITSGNENPPRLVIYFGALLMLNFMVLVTNVFTFYLYYKKGEMPYLMKNVVVDKILPKLNLICPKRKKPLSSLGTEMLDSDRGGRNIIEGVGLPNSDMQELISQVDNLRDAVIQQDTDGSMSDWKYLAVVVDRLFFVIWAIVIAIYSLVAFN